jgi:iron(III) transport system substrate-binding protein
MKRLAIIALALAGAMLRPAASQPFTPDPVLLAGARSEGAVTWYSSTPVAAAQRISDLFEKSTGVKVDLFRSGGAALIRRHMQEVEAKHVVADLLTMSDNAAASGMAKRGLFVAYRPDGFDRVPADAKDPDGYYIAQRLTLLGMMTRTDKVAAADIPKTWLDLTEPKYKGKLVMADPSFTSIQLMVVATLSQKLGWSFYEALHRNDTLIVQGHEQVFDMMKRGERLIAAEATDPRIYTGGEAPPNLANVYPATGAILVPSPTAVIAGSPHPNAAKLLAAFNLTREVQGLFPRGGHHAARTDIEPPSGTPSLESLTLYPIDYGFIEKNDRQIKQRFNDIFE